MAKISITLPNETAISLEAAASSELQEMVVLFKSSLLTDLVQLRSEAYWREDVTTKPNKSISVPFQSSGQTPVVPPPRDRKGQNGTTTQDDAGMENPLDTTEDETAPRRQVYTCLLYTSDAADE